MWRKNDVGVFACVALQAISFCQRTLFFRHQQLTYTKDVVTWCDPFRFTHTAINMLHCWLVLHSSKGLQ
jgi:hypothetical protein